jgi:DNA-binding response OmpR family regulator
MSKKIILAVDDSNTVLASIKGMLSAVYDVHTATDAKKAESTLGSITPDLMLLDIDMPGLDGVSYLKKLKSHGKTFPIIFLSSNSDNATVVKTAQLGSTGFIEKPFDKEKLLSKIEAWIG